MSPSKSKSTKAPKEQQKASTKLSSSPAHAGNGIQASAYNPVSGTFHTLETAPSASSPPPQNGRFRTMDETDEHSVSSLGIGAEYDSVSNNDSCSGESEDQKEKAANVTHRPEAIPGSDNEKRDKIRQKNERKHQRQRERRAQELHERCSGYLMSRKLEALAQQLVAMGFSSERATMALILNEGRVEESVAWLFEGGEEAAQQKDPSLYNSGNLKIDITEELAQIMEMETRYSYTKQEVERAVVTCEGDLEKASETLRAQKQEPVAPLPKQEGTGDPPATVGGKLDVSDMQNSMMMLTKSVASVTIQPRKDERDFNYTKAVLPQMPLESGNKNMLSLRRTQPKSEWTKPQAAAMPVDKRWPSVNSSPSASYSLASPMQVLPQSAKSEARYVAVTSEGKNLQTTVVREPVIMMQRPQSVNAKQNLATSFSASPPATAGWFPNSVSGIEATKTNGGAVNMSSVNPNSVNLSSQQLYHKQQYKPFALSSVDSAAAGWGSPFSHSATSLQSSLVVPSSLGLFTGWGSTGTSGSLSPVDWSTGGSMPHCDYNSIDWSVESMSTTQSEWWMGLASYMKGNRMYDGLSTTTAGAKGSRLGVNGVHIAGLQEGVVVPDASTLSSSAGSHEWTSPFEGKDLFSLSRQFVTSPSQ